ncbi:MAG: hypothetical protein ACM3RP_02805 [Chitinophagales bacterium]
MTNALSPAQAEPVLVCEGVRKDYPQGKLFVPALRGIDLTVEAGEFTALAGPPPGGRKNLGPASRCWPDL